LKVSLKVSVLASGYLPIGQLDKGNSVRPQRLLQKLVGMKRLPCSVGPTGCGVLRNVPSDERLRSKNRGGPKNRDPIYA
jgi:hypothetical protein